MEQRQTDQLLELLAEKLKDPKNASVREALRKMLDNIDIRDIRESMHLSGYRSVDYSFIEEDIVRAQLEVDNLRMEDAAKSIKLEEEERFYSFCVNAFFQIENLLNYYFAKAFPDIHDLVKFVEEKSGQYKHKEDKNGKMKERTVGDIEVVYKIFAFGSTFFPSTPSAPDFTFKILNGLRNVRNEGFHRCQIAAKEGTSDLAKFFHEHDYSSVRATLKKTAGLIKEDLAKPSETSMNLILKNKYDGSVYVIEPRTGGSFALQGFKQEEIALIEPGDKVKVVFNRRTHKLISISKTESGEDA